MAGGQVGVTHGKLQVAVAQEFLDRPEADPSHHQVGGEGREHFGVDPADPAVNIEIGVRALRDPGKHRILRRYNRGWNRAYERAVMTRYRRLKSVGAERDELRVHTLKFLQPRVHRELRQEKPR